MFDSNSSSSSDEEIVVVKARGNLPRINDFIENVVENCNNKEFQQYFQVTRVHFEQLINRLSPSLERQKGSYGRLPIPVNKQLLAVL